MQDLSIYRLAPCTENCSQRIYKTFSIKYLEHVHFLVLLNSRNTRACFEQQYPRVLSKYSVMATIWLHRKEKVYKELWYKEMQGIFIFLSNFISRQTKRIHSVHMLVVLVVRSRVVVIRTSNHQLQRIPSFSPYYLVL